MIQVENVSLIYSDHGRDVFACRDIHLEVKAGEFLGILGPSGSGKSSLLYLMSGLKNPSHGRIIYDGACISQMGDTERSHLRLSQFGFVFQQPYLLGYLSALENVLSVFKVPSAETLGRAHQLLDVLGLSHKAHRLPHELSGGERQRVCIARALVTDPKVIFADEPTAALDHTNGLNVMELLNEHRGQGTLAMVTHDPSMLGKADRVIQILDGTIDPENRQYGHLK